MDYANMDGPAVSGHLDGLEGAYIVGWAVSRDIKSCAITITDSNDKLIASGLASAEREDLRDVAGGRCNVAFRIPLPAIEIAGYLHVSADGVELHNSPLRLGQGVFDGHVSVVRSALDGWVAERYPDFVPPLITVYDQDGSLVMECQSAIDDEEDGTKFRPARFYCDLDIACFGRGELHLSVFANGVRFATVNCELPLHGYMETLSTERCAGWLLSPIAPNRKFVFEIWRDGERLNKVRCDLPRSDVQKAFPGCLFSGFDLSLPQSRQTSLDFTSLSFRLPGSGRDLFEGPYLLGSRPGMVLAARNVSSIAISQMAPLLSVPEQAVLQTALTQFVAHARQHERLVFHKRPRELPREIALTRLNILIPIYRGIAITKACIDSVLATRSEGEDRVILVNDRSPEAGMAAMLEAYSGTPNVFILTNAENLGFVKSVNRGLSFCGEGDVILLNSDTRLFPGGLTELWRVAHASPEIGTVTAISNNATIFSYPHWTLRSDRLADISWEELAAIALTANGGKIVDVPTGHGFCMLVKAEVLQRIGHLDETFGRGYGEENDLCNRAADLGYRNVAAFGALVEHRESISFVGDKAGLLAANTPILEARYPEYTPIVMEVERRDDFRTGRWSMDAARLERASAASARFALVICHGLGGGTNKAIADIEETVGYGGAEKLTLRCRPDGFMELLAIKPLLMAVFSPGESAELLEVLSAANISLVVVHQVLGFPATFINRLGEWVKKKHGVFYAHDFYPICPRVTMIDAVERFCNLASTDVCKRCIALSGAHEASMMDGLTPGEHREIFGSFLSYFKHVVAPSENAAQYYRSVFPNITVEAVSHPGPPIKFPLKAREGSNDQIVLFGAIGPHKGSAELLEIAHLARLTYPSLHFHVVGFTNRDEELLNIGNVSVTGKYSDAELPALVERTNGRLALFLSGWPETFSYTLTEAVRLGFFPIVPDIGAPADRVKTAGFGAVFQFPIVPSQVMEILKKINSEPPLANFDQGPSSFSQRENSVLRTAEIFGLNI